MSALKEVSGVSCAWVTWHVMWVVSRVNEWRDMCLMWFDAHDSRQTHGVTCDCSILSNNVTWHIHMRHMTHSSETWVTSHVIDMNHVHEWHHVRFMWIVSYVSQSCHVWTSHVILLLKIERFHVIDLNMSANVRSFWWVISQMNESHATFKFSMSRFGVKIERFHVIYFNILLVSHVSDEWVICRIWMCHVTLLLKKEHCSVTYLNVSANVHSLGESCLRWMSHMPHMNVSCHIVAQHRALQRHLSQRVCQRTFSWWVMSQINQSYAAYECVTSHFCRK